MADSQSDPRQRILQESLEAKARRRLSLARLPIEEKLRILVRLQRMGNEIRRARGRPVLPEWLFPLDDGARHK